MATLCNVDTRRGGQNSSCVRAKSCTLPEKEKLQVGVTPNCVHEKTKAWYVMRAAYGQEIKAKEYLDAKGLETFLPIIDRMRLVKGKRVRKKESLIPNFLFVLATEVELQKYVGSKDLSFFHYYYVPNMDEKGQPIGIWMKKDSLLVKMVSSLSLFLIIKCNSFVVGMKSKMITKCL